MVGIVIYELLTRSTPFEHDNAAIVYQNIIESKELLPKKFSSLLFDEQSKDVISRLVSDNPNRRLGMLRNGTHSLTYSPTHSLIYTLTYLLTHLLTYSLTYFKALLIFGAIHFSAGSSWKTSIFGIWRHRLFRWTTTRHCWTVWT